MKKLIIFFSIVSLALSSKCDTSLIDLKIKKSGVKLSYLVEKIASDCGYSIFYENGGDDIRKQSCSVIDIQKKTPVEILSILLHKYNYDYEIKDGILVISKYLTKTFKIDYIDAQRTSSSKTNVSISSASNEQGGGSLSDSGANINTIEVFDFWKTLQKDIKDLIVRAEDKKAKEPKIIINEKAGLLTVTGTKKQLDRVSEYVSLLLGRLKKQVLISVNILEVKLDKSNKTGIDWSKLQLGFGFSVHRNYANDGHAPTLIVKDSNLPNTTSWKTGAEGNSVLNFMRQFGKTTSLSNPKVVTMNGQPSLISVGSNVNYLVRSAVVSSGSHTTQGTSVRDLFVGILLDITPQIDDSDYITLKINPSVSSYKYQDDDKKQSSARELPPDTDSKRVSTVVRVRDGETIILGGFITKKNGTNDNKVAVLGDIPFVRRFFKSSDVQDVTNELVFIIKPTIISSKDNTSLKDFGYLFLDENMSK